MPYVTQKRRAPSEPTGSVWKNGVPQIFSGTPVGTLFSNYVTDESTTSYRTGRMVADLPDLEEEALFSVHSNAETFGVLRGEKERSPQSKWDTGHEFQTTKHLVSAFPMLDESVKVAGDTWRYVGPAMSDPDFHQGGSSFRSVPGAAFNEVYYGTTAINATRPTNPVADLAVNLAEFKSEGMRLNIHTDYTRDIADAARKGSDDYVNSQFGWLPLAGALQDTSTAIRNSSRIIQQYERDSGKLVRRSYDFPLQVLEETVYGNNTGNIVMPVVHSQPYQIWKNGIRTGSLRQEVRTTRSVRFSGAWTYYLNVGDDLRSRMLRYEQLSNKLLGTRLTPEVAWNLAPWSWFVDWNYDVGKIISNATALSNDSLVLAWGYITVHDIVHHRCSITGPETLSGQRGPFVTNMFTITKRRYKANPYGFAAVPGGLSLRQSSILAALGFTSAPGVLRSGGDSTYVRGDRSGKRFGRQRRNRFAGSL